MKKILLALVLVMLVFGCASKYQQLLEKIPYAQFETFKYQRGGSMTSAMIECNGATLTEEGIIIDKIVVMETTPWLTINIELLNYERRFKASEEPINMMDAIR